jgi:hypothetical protein
LKGAGLLRILTSSRDITDMMKSKKAKVVYTVEGKERWQERDGFRTCLKRAGRGGVFWFWVWRLLTASLATATTRAAGVAVEALAENCRVPASSWPGLDAFDAGIIWTMFQFVFINLCMSRRKLYIFFQIIL